MLRPVFACETRRLWNRSNTVAKNPAHSDFTSRPSTVDGIVTSIAIIGRSRDQQFSDVIDHLKKLRHVQIVGEFPSISEAFHQGLMTSIHADVVIVLQAFSDEYISREVSQLIGQMLFGRVFCCYGTWCQADGRSHDIWPVSTRVPIASAIAVIASELAAFREGVSPVSPMSAAEEVFLHRFNLQPDFPRVASRVAIVVSDEVVLRRTLALMCQSVGRTTYEARMDVSDVEATISRLFVRPADFGSDFGRVDVFVDLDPLNTTCVEILGVLHDNHPECRVIGLSVFSDVAADLPGIELVVDKTEFFTMLSLV